MIQQTTFKNEKLHADVLRRLAQKNRSQQKLADLKVISRATLHRLQKGKPIQLATLFKIIDWLETDINLYIKQKQKTALK